MDCNPRFWWKQRSFLAIAGAWLVLCLISLILARRNGSEPGLYYDEAVFAGTAKEFLTSHLRSSHMPGMTLLPINGAPFPLLIQPYLGGLKSGILAFAFWLFGPTTAVVRFTSLGCNIIGLLFLMLWIRRWFSVKHAILTTTILATDPAFFFLGVLDWGVAVPSLVCRFAGYYFINIWWTTNRKRYLIFAAFIAGIGFFNKIDFAVLIIGAITAAIACNYVSFRDLVLRKPGQLVLAAIAFFLGSAPTLINVPGILFRILSGTANTGENSESIEKYATTLAMYDGSYFYRLMDSGGVFSDMNRSSVPAWTPFGVMVIAAIIGFAIALFRSRNSVSSRFNICFPILALILISVGAFVLPGAVRIHHTILPYPFPHLLIANAFFAVWDFPFRSSSINRLAKGSMSAGVFFLLTSQLLAIIQTQNVIHGTGGRDRWSNSFDEFCRKVDNHPELTIVSLDWGFNEQLNFLTSGPRLAEPFWNSRRVQFTPNTIYLSHTPEVNLIPIATDALNQAKANPNVFDIQAYHDRGGRTAFYTIRLRAKK